MNTTIVDIKEGLYLNLNSLSMNVFEWEDEAFASLPLKEFKYKRWDWAFDRGVDKSVQPLLEKMFDNIPDSHKDMRWLVDYKVRDLVAGDCGCGLEGWHTDVVTNPNHPTKPDYHLIYSTIQGTDFLTKPIVVCQEDSHFMHCLETEHTTELEKYSLSAPANAVHAYNRWQLHRGPKIIKDCRRMLLRLTDTEVIR